MRRQDLLRQKGWETRAKGVRLLLLDVDGVLTDGRISLNEAGREFKFFNIKDGQGIKLLQQAGLRVGILSGRRSPTVRLRAKELEIGLLRQGVPDKGEALEAILRKEKFRAEQICYVGDDLVDLPVFYRVGFAVAVADSVEEVKAKAHYITRHQGGEGAVREVCDLILKAQGKWEAATKKYFQALR